MRRGSRSAFTLTELAVVIGSIAALCSLMLPVAAKARATARATGCLSNLRQMGTAWTVYLAENRSALPQYVWNTPRTPDLSWKGSWLGILDAASVRDGALLCPEAAAPSLGDAMNLQPRVGPDGKPVPPRRGYGSASYAWTGRYGTNGTAVRFDAQVFREGSYGYNRYATAGNGLGPNGRATNLLAVKTALCDVPVFMDCTYADVAPANGVPAAPVAMPPDLTGASVVPGTPEHWKLLIARHGKAINVCMADGSVRMVPLSELYDLTWKTGWQKYDLAVP